VVRTAEGSADGILTTELRLADPGAGGEGASVPFALLNSHLPFRQAGEAQAMASLRWAREWMRANPSGLLSWAGDFNLEPRHPLVPAMLALGMQDALGWSTTPTYFPDPGGDAQGRPKRCDYILYSAHSLALSSAHVRRTLADAQGGSEGSGDDADLDAGPGRPPRPRGERGGGGLGRAKVTLRQALALAGSDHIPVVATLVPTGSC
jgi:endonuclease/exonuclease/phosphatase family metal-dependent hydrolase